MKGVKRFIALDTDGLLLRVAVLSASVQEWDGLLDRCLIRYPVCPRVTAGWVDQGFAGGVAAVQERYGWTLEVVRKDPGPRGVVVQPRRWLVERSHRWLHRFRRRLSRWQKHPQHSLGLLHRVCAVLPFRAARLRR